MTGNKTGEGAGLSGRGPSPRLWYALCFALPAVVLTLVYAAEGFAPFGDKSILSYDMSQQYVEYFCALKRGDVFFSWSKAMGTSYIGVFSYYLSSPLSILTLLVPNEAMPVGLMWLVVLKLGLAGLSYGIFARHWFGRLDAMTVLCALGYSLCTYAVAYSMCIMWLDSLIWLPVILLGMERQLEGRTRWLLPASLTVCFVSNWYTSYMIGGFCCLWFLYRAVARGIRGKELLLRGRDFLLSAVWALCLTAWLWLPSYLAMTGGKMTAAGGDWRGAFTFDLAKLLPQFFYGRFDFFYDRALPYVFCGTLLFFAAVGYFFLRAVALRERLAAAGVLAVLILSMWISALDRVWHLFQVTHSFPYRYSFVISFLVVFLAQHTLNQLSDALPASRFAPLALGAVMCWEMGANAGVIFQTVDRCEPYWKYSAYTADFSANAALVKAAGDTEGEDPFFRMGATYDRGLNGPLTFGYHGITHYSSLYNARLNATLRDLGLAQSWYWSAYYGSSQFTDALFDVRYVITDRDVPGYAKLSEADGLGLYRNPSVLPLAFVAKSLPDPEDSAARLQNRVFSGLTGMDEALFTPARPQWEDHEGWWVSLSFEGQGLPIYLDLRDGAVTDLQKDGGSLLRYGTNTGKTRCLHCIGAPEVGETLTVLVTYSGSWEPTGKCWYFDDALLARGVESLRNTAVETVTNSKVALTADAGSGGPLVTTIPVEDGWAAWVDGERAELDTWLDGTFWRVDLPGGEHTVTLRYTAPGLIPGVILGVLAALGAGGQWYWTKKRKKPA